MALAKHIITDSAKSNPPVPVPVYAPAGSNDSEGLTSDDNKVASSDKCRASARNLIRSDSLGPVTPPASATLKSFHPPV